MKTFVIDPGYSSFKVAVLENSKIRKIFKEPSILAEIPSWADFDLGMSGNNGVEWRDKRYNVGLPGCSGLEIPVNNPETLYLTALPVFLLRQGIKQEDRVIVLMSLADWVLKQKVIETLKEIVSEVKIIPQGVGVWLEAKAPAECTIVDVGFNTVDVITFANSKPEKNLSFSAKEAGIISFLSLAIKDDPKHTTTQLESGDEELTRILKENFWNWLKTRLSAFPQWKYASSKKLIFGGGGARFIDRKVGMVVKYPEFANVAGIAKLAIVKEREESYENN